MKKYIKKIIPLSLLKIIRSLRLEFKKSMFKNTNIEEAMSMIYKRGYWGKDSHFPFFSGRGSHDAHIVKPYLNCISNFLEGKDLVLLDFGCGDFNIGVQLVSFTRKYIAVDIVDSLISYNKIKYKHISNLNFYKLDMTSDVWPDADVVVIRQVLQHLSNSDVFKVLDNLKKYKYAIITEGLPKGNFEANLDNFTGPDIRLSKNSGLVLDMPPFNLNYISKSILLEIEDIEDDAIIRTTLYKFI